MASNMKQRRLPLGLPRNLRLPRTKLEYMAFHRPMPSSRDASPAQSANARRHVMPWLFYRNETNEWQWTCVSEDGSTEAQSATCFATRLECIADAKLNGFGQDSMRRSTEGGDMPSGE
ncbi:MAG: hypothetical protein ACM3RQ_00280 [Methanocella sp.]